MTTRGRGKGQGGSRSGRGRGGKGGGRNVPAASLTADPALELHPVDVPPDIQSFTEWPLSDDVQAAILGMGITKPTPIQALAIGPVLEGRDVIAKAETGTGKTLAFGAPMVSKIDPSRRAVLGLVLCPTRELAQQVAGVLEELGRAKGLKVALLVGGDPIPPQIRQLQAGTQLVVGTPGRVLDLMGQRFLSFPWTEFVVLDEADEMLEIGFLDDVEKILLQTPEERQTLLFSATFPPALLTLARKHTRTPVELATARGVATTSNIRQSVVFCRDEDDRTDLLRTIIRRSTPDDLMLCFCDRRTDVDKTMRRLERLPEGVKALHGGYDQASRFRVMSAFREGSVRALLATDVASRGLDVQGVTHVINCGVPREVSTYTHRIGRTGRAGRQGHAITIVAGGDVRRWKELVRHMNWEVEELEPGEFVRLFGAPQAEETRRTERPERGPREAREARGERGERRERDERSAAPRGAREEREPRRSHDDREPRRGEGDEVRRPERSNPREEPRRARPVARAEERDVRDEQRAPTREAPRADSRARSAPRGDESRDERGREPVRGRERTSASERPARSVASGDPERDARRAERSALRRAQSESETRAPAAAPRSGERPAARERAAARTIERTADRTADRTSERTSERTGERAAERSTERRPQRERDEQPVRSERVRRDARNDQPEAPAERGPRRTDAGDREAPRRSAREPRSDTPRMAQRRELREAAQVPEPTAEPVQRERVRRERPAAEEAPRERSRTERTERPERAERPARTDDAPSGGRVRSRTRSTERTGTPAPEPAPRQNRERESDEPAPERRRVRSADRAPRGAERGSRPANSGGFGDGLD
jgi:superfamily II DNA/RNA helicase